MAQFKIITAKDAKSAKEDLKTVSRVLLCGVFWVLCIFVVNASRIAGANPESETL